LAPAGWLQAGAFFRVRGAGMQQDYPRAMKNGIMEVLKLSIIINHDSITNYPITSIKAQSNY
jgi:hypothetical protein